MLFKKDPPKVKKGREFDQMPFFLSDQYKLILEQN